MPECENLPLISHLICPVQRVMRYQLLLKEYLKYLKPEDEDYEDTEKALELVLEAASHANEMMRRLVSSFFFFLKKSSFQKCFEFLGSISQCA